MKRLALLVATSEYPECEGLKPLHGSLLDVDAMQRVLVSNGEFANEDVIVLKNATRQVIEEAIHNLFNGSDRKKDDLVLFYFSGHGVVDEANKLFLGTPSTRKGTNNKLVKPTTVAASYLQEAMQESKSQHQVLIFNCCFSGAFAEGMTVMDDSSVNLKTQLGGKGRAILTSSSSTQFSFQPDGEMSIYTRYLVEGIETGAADTDRDSKISVDELHEYAALKVSQESPNMTPAFYPVEQGGKIYIAKVTQAKDDPRLVYRRELESRMVDENFSFSASELEKNIDKDLISILFKSMWSPAARRILDKLGLSEVESEQIKIEVLKPILAKARKLIEYEELLKEMLPPTTQELKDLRDYQKDHLGLRDEDVMDIDNRHGLTIITTMPMKESEPLTIDLGSGVMLELVRVPAGKFIMGSDESDSEKPIHEVQLKEFLIGKYAVTNAQWQAVMKAKGSDDYDKKFQGDLQPVVGVTWNESREFCRKLSELTGRELRLPTEAEWEYTCRAGSKSKYCFGDAVEQLEKYAWFGNNSGDLPLDALQIWNTDSDNYTNRIVGNNCKTHPVGEKLPNAWGLYDLHGNVWEWCLDEWHDSYKDKSEQLKKSGNEAWGYLNVDDNDNRYRLLRGGSSYLDARNCRSASRFNAYARIGTYYVGFRVVCVVR